jgi:hypothetical protein
MEGREVHERNPDLRSIPVARRKIKLIVVVGNTPPNPRLPEKVCNFRLE